MQATLLRVGAAALRAPRVAQRTERAPLAGLRCSAGVQAWLAENGGKAMCSSSVAGLVATTDLKAGEEACSVSIKSCFTAVIMNAEGVHERSSETEKRLDIYTQINICAFVHGACKNTYICVYIYMYIYIYL